MSDQAEETAYPDTPKDFVDALQNGWCVDDGNVVHRANKNSLPFDDYVIGMYKFFNYGNQKAMADIPVPGHIAQTMLDHFQRGAHSVRYPIRAALGV